MGVRCQSPQPTVAPKWSWGWSHSASEGISLTYLFVRLLTHWQITVVTYLCETQGKIYVTVSYRNSTLPFQTWKKKTWKSNGCSFCKHGSCLHVSCLDPRLNLDLRERSKTQTMWVSQTWVHPRYVTGMSSQPLARNSYTANELETLRQR